MKILFYDMSAFEHEYFLKNSLNLLEPYFFKNPLNSSTFVNEKYKDCEAISVFVDSELDCETLSQFENLKFIFLRCSGYSHVDLKYCKANKIHVFNVPEYGSNSVAEFAFGLILNLSRNIISANSKLKKGKINRDDLIGYELNNKTIGVVGVGVIGKKVINIAKGFNMNILCYDIKEKEDCNYLPFDELIKQSDFIVICCPLNKNTKYMFNKSTISKMKRTAFLINVARGEIINTSALYDEIANKKILGAGLDAIECEQILCKLYDKCSKKDMVKSNCTKKYLFASKLLQKENILMTPHIAYNTYEARQKIVEITLQNIMSCFNINYGTKNLILI